MFELQNNMQLLIVKKELGHIIFFLIKYYFSQPIKSHIEHIIIQT